ncbi:hypothetical protein [Defluviimonas salinarum]|uniref:Restriction endonuclease n=1 Tax=Defluviimonas salinarum TaxID=2992147 RepID=A0ABT3J875_9RHOB|nr:hypothetical protein [Defluviimonas salinarum]MCW3783890.1 hypothetical protein [Defluviimonas salinarum]
MRFPTDPRLSPDQAAALRRNRVLGKGAERIILEIPDMARLIGVLDDVARSAADPARLRDHGPAAAERFYREPDRAAAPGDGGTVSPGAFVDAYLEAHDRIPDFDRAFSALCEITKRRQKLRSIMSSQPMPVISDIAMRSPLEYLAMDDEAMASWMIWRKWLYDIDNRIGQETGYLVASVMALALGGRVCEARTSPIRRSGGDFARRRVDCIKDNRAYDLKARLTDAPSRRARMGDEMAFARDCSFSGFVPVLLVLEDPGPGRSEELVEAYANYGGSVLYGEEAWSHVHEHAGPMMSAFVDLFLRRPVRAISNAGDRPLDLTLRASEEGINIELLVAEPRMQAMRFGRA